MKTVTLALERVMEFPIPIIAAGLAQLPPWAEELGGGVLFGAVAAFYVMYLAAREIGVFAAIRAKLFPNGASDRRTDRWEEVLGILEAMAEPKDEDDIRAEVEAEINQKEHEEEATRHRKRSREMHKALLGPNGLIAFLETNEKSRDRQTQAILARLTAVEGTGTAVNSLKAEIKLLTEAVGRLKAAG